VDRVKDIAVDIFMPSSDEHAALKLELVLLPALLLDDLFLLARLALVVSVSTVSALRVWVAAHARLAVVLLLLFLINAFNLIVVFFLIWDIKQFEESTLELVLLILHDLKE